MDQRAKFNTGTSPVIREYSVQASDQTRGFLMTQVYTS